MNRKITLPGGCKNLSDMVRLIGKDNRQIGLVTLAHAQMLAKEQQAELVRLTTPPREPIFRLVDEATWRRLKQRRRKT